MNEQKGREMLCKAIINGKLPGEALSWDVLEVVSTSPIVGSGESTSWRSMVTVRRNGKQVWRGTASEWHDLDYGIMLTGGLEFAVARSRAFYAMPTPK